QARELRPPSQGAEDVAPPSEDDPANDGTCRPVQAVELRPAEPVDAALARPLGDAVVDPRRRPIGPGDRSQADGRERLVVWPRRRMEQRGKTRGPPPRLGGGRTPPT